MTLSDVLYGGDKRTVPNTGGGWSWGNPAPHKTPCWNMSINARTRRP